MFLDDDLRKRLDVRRSQHRIRTRTTVDSAQSPVLLLGNKRLLNFCSNDYLGLAGHPQVRAAFVAAAKVCGVGSGASHLVCGHNRYHHALEDALAEFTGRPRALLFSTGYMANLGTINALVGRGDAVFQDKLNHASLLDAGRLSGADFVRYRHNDTGHLEARLTASKANRKLIAVDGVFSMDGDTAPLSTLAELAQAHGAWLMVDDAHGFGVLGGSGGGISELFAMNIQQLPILMGTLGKALGTFGAFVAGSEALIEALIQFARPYIYTTAMPPAVAAATLKSLEIIQAEPERRAHLGALIARFRSLAADRGIVTLPSETAIQPLLIGDDRQTVKVAQALHDDGIWVGAIRPPTVPEGTARLRITLSAGHQLDDIDILVEALARHSKRNI